MIHALRPQPRRPDSGISKPEGRLSSRRKEDVGGLAFMVNGKMCINVGNDRLMCRFDPALTEQLSKRAGYLPLTMKGKEYTGYCYVDPVGYQSWEDFDFWISLCLDYNGKATLSKKKGN